VVLIACAAQTLLVLDTGVSGHHFLIVLALLVASIGVIRGWLYYCLVLLLSLTTLVSMYGSLGFDIATAPGLAPALAPGNNYLTRVFMDTFTNDRFIAFAVASNILVLVSAAVYVVVGRTAVDAQPRVLSSPPAVTLGSQP
jgi:hypothetical protein